MLAIMAEKEKLIGLRVLVLKFMTNIISQLRNPVLAHQSFFGPIQVRLFFKIYYILYLCVINNVYFNI